MISDASLLIYAPVPLHRRDGALFVEDQAIVGLRRWTENFGHVTAMMPLSKAPPPAGWSPAAALDGIAARLTLEPLPMAYRPDRFLRALPATRARIRGLIAGHDYLSFAIGGLFGDWGTLACLTAHRMRRPYAVWTDRVESEVTRLEMHEGPWRHRLRRRLTHRPMAALERAVIRRAALGLFHGRDTFETYAPHCREPQVVHDILLARDDHIAPARLQQKLAEAGDGPLRIVYAGRAAAMKGPFDWLAVLERLQAQGTYFTATWLGDGPERPEMLRRIAAAGLAGRVAAPGFVADRAEVLEALRAAHVLLFCHLTPESPRCLIEALVSATPVVGHEGAYARELIAAHGGGHLRPPGDIAGLAAHLGRLAGDRGRLRAAMQAALRDGERFDDVTVFRHRSELIKRHLPLRPGGD